MRGARTRTFPGPPIATVPRDRAVRAPDRSVSTFVQFVYWQFALVDIPPDVLVRPVRERARLPELVALVPAELRRVYAGRRLVAADARDPAVEPGERL